MPFIADPAINQFGGLAYNKHRPDDPKVASWPVFVRQDGTYGPQEGYDNDNHFGIKVPRGFRIDATQNFTISTIPGSHAREQMSIQVVTDQVDAAGTIVVEQSVNGRDWNDLPTPVSIATVANAIGRESAVINITGVGATYYRLRYTKGAATGGWVEVYSS